MNWSLYSDDASSCRPSAYPPGKDGRAEISFIRVEYQTLRKLPKSAISFSRSASMLIRSPCLTGILTSGALLPVSFIR
ncbi:MAG: hypothetical protein R3D34_00665 [Nitratireductor sp.]